MNKNGTKWYKLTKSSESLQMFLEERISKIECDLSDKITEITVTLIEVLFSLTVTFFIETNQPAIINWINFDVSTKIDTIIFWVEAFLSFMVIFVIVFIIFHLICNKVLKIYEKLKDNKKTFEDRYRLKVYFYKQILNDIITGLSLEKKADELIKEKNQKPDTNGNNNDMYLIYLIEALFYFNEANQKIIDKNIIEITNRNRIKNIELIRLINPEFSKRIFQICIATLTRLDNALKENNFDYCVDELIEAYSSYIETIDEQFRS